MDLLYLEKQPDQKLDTQPAQPGKAQTSTPKLKLKFTDYAIERFVGNFIYVDDEGNTKTRDRVTIKFDVQKNSVLKGLYITS